MVLKISILQSLARFLLKFAIVFKFFEHFCPFLSLTISTGQRQFLGLAVGLYDRTLETKNGFEKFLL